MNFHEKPCCNCTGLKDIVLLTRLNYKLWKIDCSHYFHSHNWMVRKNMHVSNYIHNLKWVHKIASNHAIFFLSSHSPTLLVNNFTIYIFLKPPSPSSIPTLLNEFLPINKIRGSFPEASARTYTQWSWLCNNMNGWMHHLCF